jgi:hypothetical protein
MPNGFKQSSAELSTLAGRVMRLTTKQGQTVSRVEYNELLYIAKRLAGSVLGQDEEGPKSDVR